MNDPYRYSNRNELPTEEEVISGLQARDIEAMALLAALFATSMKRFLARSSEFNYRVSTEDIEDIVSETLIYIYEHFTFNAAKGSFKTWVINVTKHRAREYLEHLKEETGKELTEEGQRVIWASSERRPSDEQAGEQLDPAILAALDNERPKFKEYIQAVYQEGESPELIAANRGVKVATVRSELSRAYGALRKKHVVLAIRKNRR
jgi:RNA polymerase sigma factor (sigma-70 family)